MSRAGLAHLLHLFLQQDTVCKGLESAVTVSLGDKMRSLKSILPLKRSDPPALPTHSNDSSIDLESIHTAEPGPSRLPMSEWKVIEGKDGYQSTIPTLTRGHGPSDSLSDTQSHRNPFSSTNETLPTFNDASQPPAAEEEQEKIKGPKLMDMVKEDYRVGKDLLKRMTWRDWVKIFCKKRLISE